MTADKLPSLANLSEEFGALLRFEKDDASPDRVDSNTGEVLTDDEFLAKFEAASGSTEEKVKRTVAFQMDVEAEVIRLRNDGELVKAKAQRYFDAADRLEVASDRLDRLMLLVVKKREAAALAAGKKPKDARKIETPWGSVGYRTDKSVEIAPGTVLPKELYNPPRKPPEPTPNKAAIRKQIEAGVPVEGCRIEETVRLTRPKFDGETADEKQIEGGES